MLVRRSLAATLVLGLALGACSSDDDPQARPAVSEQHAAVEPIDLDVVGTERISPHRHIEPLDAGTHAAVLEALQTTFDVTVVGPVTGQDPEPTESVFTVDAAARATGPDRAVLFDEGLPAVGVLVADKTNVRLTGLDGDDGKPALVIAKIDWDVRSDDGAVRIQRVGELSLIPVLGRWLVGAYSVITTRTTGGATTTTTAATP